MLRQTLRRVIPSTQRAHIRRWLNDLPFRLQDATTDFREILRPSTPPVPPASLRLRVGRNSSRQEFLTVGRRCADDVFEAFDEARDRERAYARWLDFGCGCGRVARHLLERPEVDALDGIDVDAQQVAWTARHLPGQWLAISGDPRLPTPSGSYDVVFSVSVFTHLSQPEQDAWLAELRRILAPGGLLIVSTHSPKLANEAFSLQPSQQQALDDSGFLYVAAAGAFNEHATFHSEAYLRSVWTRHFELRVFQPAGLGDYQDLSVCSVWS